MNPSSGISGPSAVSTWDLLLTLGFVQDQSVFADQPPGISFDFGNFKLEASRLTNRWEVPTVLLGGVMASERTIALVHAELALQVESREQGLAFVAWSLDNSAGGRFQLTIEPPWLVEGRRSSPSPALGEEARRLSSPTALLRTARLGPRSAQEARGASR